MAKLQPDVINWILKLNASQANKEIHNLNNANKELKESNKDLKRSMLELDAAGKHQGEEWQNLNNIYIANRKAINDNNLKITECEKRLDKTTMSTSQLSKKSKELKRELDNTSKSLEPKKYAQLRKELGEVERATNKLSRSNKNLLSTFVNFQKIKSVIAGIFVGIGQMITGKIITTIQQAISTIIDFEKANSTLAAIVGTTKDGIKDLTAQARELGATTRYTASEVTGLQTELAKLGFKEDFILKMTAPILKFATAVGTDLSQAATLAGATLRIFGLKAEDTERVVSTLSMGCNASALSFDYLNNAMSTVGPVANAFGFTVEDTTALLGALSNSGFDASSAATATRNILLNLADSSGKLAQALGHPVQNLDDLVIGLKKLDREGVDLATTLELTDKRSVAAFNSFMKNADTIALLQDSVTGAEGAFNDMAKEMSNNVKGSISRLNSTLEGIILRFYESRGIMKLLVDATTKLFEAIGWLIDKFNEWSMITHTLTVGLITYYTALGVLATYQKMVTAGTMLNTIALKAQSLMLALSRASALLYVAAQALLDKNTTKATAALRLMRLELIKNPVALMIAVVVAAGFAIKNLIQDTNELTEAQKENAEIEKMANDAVAEKKTKIDLLLRTIHNETLAYDERLNAIKRLQEIVPDYHASLSKEGQIYNENKKSIDNYLTALRKTITAKASEERLVDLNKRKMDFDAKFKKTETDAKNMSTVQVLYKIISNGGIGSDDIKEATDALSEYREVCTQITELEGNLDKQNSEEFQKQKEYAEKNIDLIQVWEDKKKEAEKMPGDNYEELGKRNRKIQTIDAEISRLKELGKVKKDVGGRNNHSGEYKDNDIKATTNPIEATHKENMGDIKESRRAGKKSEAQYTLDETEEILRYHKERIAKLKELDAKTPEDKKKLHDEIKLQIATSENEITETKVKAEDARIQIVKDRRQNLLDVENAFYNEQKNVMDRELANGSITQGQYDAYMLSTNKAHSEKLLSIETVYAGQVNQLQITNANKKIDLIKEANENERLARMQNYRDIVAITQMVKSAEEKGVGREGKEAEYNREKELITKKYDAAIAIARAAGLDTKALEEQKNQDLIALDYQYQNSLYQIQQQIGVSWKEEYDNELRMLKNQLDRKDITEKEYEKKKFNLKVKFAKKYFDFAAGASAELVDSLQNAEIEANNAKYDVLIENAKGNNEEQERLQNEKAEKELEIQKKYADVNFAIKASQIIADTAVSIMKALAELGPIAGPIAAAVIGATGLIQLAGANAERQKIKNLRLNSGSTSNSSSTPSAQRRVSGYSEGGYTGDGDRYEVAGYVHRGEYVVPMPEMRNPRVIDAVTVIEAIRKQRTGQYSLPTPESGFAEGGYTGSPTGGISMSQEEIKRAIAEFKEVCASLKNIRAYIVYQDFEKSKKKLDDARNKFTRNK